MYLLLSSVSTMIWKWMKLRVLFEVSIGFVDFVSPVLLRETIVGTTKTTRMIRLLNRFWHMSELHVFLSFVLLMILQYFIEISILFHFPCNSVVISFVFPKQQIQSRQHFDELRWEKLKIIFVKPVLLFSIRKEFHLIVDVLSMTTWSNTISISVLIVVFPKLPCFLHSFSLPLNEEFFSNLSNFWRWRRRWHVVGSGWKNCSIDYSIVPAFHSHWRRSNCTWEKRSD